MSSDMSSTEHSDHSPSTVPVGGDELSTHTSIVMGNLADTGAANELQQAELGGDTMSPPDFDVSEVELQELSDLSASSADAPMQVPLSAEHGDHDDQRGAADDDHDAHRVRTDQRAEDHDAHHVQTDQRAVDDPQRAVDDAHHADASQHDHDHRAGDLLPASLTGRKYFNLPRAPPGGLRQQRPDLTTIAVCEGGSSTGAKEAQLLSPVSGALSARADWVDRQSMSRPNTPVVGSHVATSGVGRGDVGPAADISSDARASKCGSGHSVPGQHAVAHGALCEGEQPHQKVAGSPTGGVHSNHECTSPVSYTHLRAHET